MRLKSFTVIAVATLAAVPAALAGASGTAVKKPVAYLHIDARVGCAQAAKCHILPTWMRSLRNPMDVVVFADGSLYYKAQVITVARPGAGPHRCDKTLFGKPFSGPCTVSDFGVGFVKKTSIPGAYGGPDIWVSSETALIGSSTVEMVNPFGPYPADTANPSRPGHYTIEQIVPASDRLPGETLTVDVTRTAVK